MTPTLIYLLILLAAGALAALVLLALAWGGQGYSFTVNTTGPVPHRCPVCEGRGSVPNGFYVQSEGTNDQPCQACGGTGVLWR